ncbi:MAG TPA: sigma-54 dependent transcriptional regulator [Bryobacteraceae bacterium]|nr:sigma-54 dependent transcriptional regulator [Bryobacteraceae bacterium]
MLLQGECPSGTPVVQYSLLRLQPATTDELISRSRKMEEIKNAVRMVSPTQATVLITGETGTGKELVARAIHRESKRASGPFIAVNCGALPEALIATELFGHERGAFTGALQRRLGRFEMAHGGTLFLDEVAELPLETQATLLRALQDRSFERMGGSSTVRVDVRVIAATNRDLQAAVSEDRFRMDLYYRFAVFPIELPPLRERPEDIGPLLEHFVAASANRLGKHFEAIDPRTVALCEAYSWPGNIRELENVVERAAILAAGDVFSIPDSALRQSSQLVQKRPATSARSSLPEMLDERERSLIEEALLETSGRISGPAGAAVRLGISATTLESKIKAWAIDKFQYRSAAMAR